MPQCSTCGSAVSEQDRICPDCGMELGTSSDAQTAKPSAPGSPAPAPPSSSQAVASSEPAGSVNSPAQPVIGLAKLTLRRAGALTTETFPFGEHVTIGRFDVETGPVD